MRRVGDGEEKRANVIHAGSGSESGAAGDAGNDVVAVPRKNHGQHP